MDEPLQKTLERYDVLDRIAVGGMAEVFLAKAYGAHGFEKTLAIKRILPELARDPEFEARFIAEAKVAVRLSHANVVQVFDFGRIGESLFIAMEFVDGLDLAALLRKLKDEGRLVPLPAAFHIAIEIVRALDFAHTHNVVHRDVSPSNILISRAGEVKIGDFGIAVAAAPHKAAGPGARKVMGKWRYMSPEQTRGDTLDTRSDLFSAASVLFELFTGEKLFPGDEAEEIISNIEKMAIPKASSIRPALPSRLDDILAGPLSRKPIDRPNRPAVMLRSLIELSYESSIMATALDVAEAVATVLPPPRPHGPGAALDDVIRKQLGAAQAEKSVARRTAVTSNKPPGTATLEREEAKKRGEVSTGLFRKIGADGVSRLEEEPGAAAGAPFASSPDSGLHKLLDAHFDPDRRTEVGGPPTGQVPKTEPVGDEAGAAGAASDAAEPSRRSISVTTATTDTGPPARPRRSAAIAIGAVVAIAGAGAGAWALLKDRGGEPRVVTPGPGDARVDDRMGRFEIDPQPEGARGTIRGADGKVYDFGPTTHAKPTKFQVSADLKFHVHIELAGCKPYDTDRTVLPGETMLIDPHLERARAALHVTSTPPGAQVTLAGRVLGDTPLTRDDLDDAAGATLVIDHAGFEPVKVKVDLVAGKTVEIDQALKAATKYGTLNITMKDAWGTAYLNGVRLGDAPGPGFRVPVGRQRLHFVNDKTNKTWDVVCDVDETKVNTCVAQPP